MCCLSHTMPVARADIRLLGRPRRTWWRHPFVGNCIMATVQTPLRNEQLRNELRGNVLAMLFLLLLGGSVVVAFGIDHRSEPGWGLFNFWPWGKLVFLSLTLAGLLLVARWYKRLGNNSDIEELQKAAFSYRLGGAMALRPFVCANGEQLNVNSKLSEYLEGIQQPEFLKTAINPPFILALVLVLALGLLSFYAEDLDIVGKPSLILSGPIVAQEPWLFVHPDQLHGAATGGPDQEKVVLYQSGAVACIAYALLGALVWSIVYLARRMSLRDVTPHAFQTIAVRICVILISQKYTGHSSRIPHRGRLEVGLDTAR